VATNKAVGRSGGSLRQIVNYVSQDEKTANKELISGYNCSPVPEQALAQMRWTKKAWGKTDGRQYVHFVQSFHPNEKVTPEKVHEIAQEFARKVPVFQGHEVLIATHVDKAHLHTHFIVNSVNIETGRKIQTGKKVLYENMNISDDICRKRGLNVPEKGFSFYGDYIERENRSINEKNAYHTQKRAKTGEYASWVKNIHVAVTEAQKTAQNRTEFIDTMRKQGYATKWNDDRKYITWIDLQRESAGETKCKVRNSRLLKLFGDKTLDKDSLEWTFRQNERDAVRVRRDTRKGGKMIDVFIGTNPQPMHLQKAMKMNLGIALSGALVEVIIEIVRCDYPALLQDFNRWENKVNWADEPHKPVWLEEILKGCFMYSKIQMYLSQNSELYESRIFHTSLTTQEAAFEIADEIMNLEETADIRKFVKKLLHNEELLRKRGGKC
jgi:translation initiation factor 1 (eIF-1/SUI1)